MSTQPDHNPDENGWCQNDGCMWNSWNAKSDPPCPTKLPKRAGTIQEQEELLHGRPPEPTGNAGEVERLEAIWKELPNCGNPRCLPYRDSKGEFQPESLCRVCDASIGGILALIATHDRARLDAVLEAIGAGEIDYSNYDTWAGMRKNSPQNVRDSFRAKLRTAVLAIFKMEDK